MCKLFPAGCYSLPCPHPQTSLKLEDVSIYLTQTYTSGSELGNTQRPHVFCGLEWEWRRGQEGKAGQLQASEGRIWCPEEWQARGVAQRSVHFQVTHSGVYCPGSQLNDVMFRLRLSVMLKSVVCTPGGKRQRESCKSGFCKAFVCVGFWEIKADSCNISTEGAAQTSKSFLFYLPEPPVRSLHQLKADDAA